MECAILAKMDHPNVVKLHEVYEEEQFYCMVTEVVSGGELFDAIISKGKFSEKEAATLARRVLAVLRYCKDH
jgi:calcium-dependent protein kinase